MLYLKVNGLAGCWGGCHGGRGTHGGEASVGVQVEARNSQERYALHHNCVTQKRENCPSSFVLSPSRPPSC